MKTGPFPSIAAPIEDHSPTEAGFTLIEVLVAMSIISISAMAILPLVWTTMAENRGVHLKNKAKEVAIEKIEELAALPEESIEHYLGSVTTYTSPTEYLTEEGSVTSDSSALFQRTFNITEVPGVAVYPKPVVFTCVVQYPYKGKIRSCSFTTMGSF